jgi:hypothetical protein
MAAGGENVSGRVYPDLKTDFLETMFLSKNVYLNRIIRELTDGNFEKNVVLYGIIKNNKWEVLNEYIERNSGKDKFLEILKQLFLFKYFLSEDERISRKQFENAMGIQQVRWMVDPENCRYKSKNSDNTENGRNMGIYKVDKAQFYYWQNISEENRRVIIKKLDDMIKERLTTRDIDYNTIFNNTVWYKVDFLDLSGEKISIGWPGFGIESDFYPIPETLNISNIACIYQPKLVFGSLSDLSLIRFIIKYKQRPYVAHIPESKSNLCDIHMSKHSIVAGWYHDFFHSRTGRCREGLSWLNGQCKLSTPLDYDTVIRAVDDERSELIQCLLKDTTNRISRAANDSGMLFHNPVPHYTGGNRRKTRRRKSTRRKSYRHKSHGRK